MASKTQKIRNNGLTPNTNDVPMRVITVPGKSGKVTRNFAYEIENFGTLGREIKISPKSNVSICRPGLKHEYFVPTISILIGIGKNHTAELIMDVEAWEALKAGKEIDITTTKEFKEKFL